MWKRIFTIIVYIFAAAGFVLVAGYFAIRLGLTNQKGIIDLQREAFLGGASTAPPNPLGPSDQNLPWPQTEEWGVLSAALGKDQNALTRAASDSGVPARLIAANLIAEQLRLFFTEREFYKQFFYPLKILGSQTQFSWGVMGMKEATAIQVENNLKNPTSPYYPGPQYAHLLDFKTQDAATERFQRMTDQHDHYWSYLYAGLFLKEIEMQWKNAGYPIDTDIAVLSTLYNIGFEHSNPNAHPNVGGASIMLGGKQYSFGGLAAEFYASDLLTNLFPRT